MKAIESYVSPHWLPQLVLSALVCFLVMLSAWVWFKMQDWKAEQRPVEQAALSSYSWMWKTTYNKAQPICSTYLVAPDWLLTYFVGSNLSSAQMPPLLQNYQPINCSHLADCRAVSLIGSKIGLVGIQLKYMLSINMGILQIASSFLLQWHSCF